MTEEDLAALIAEQATGDAEAPCLADRAEVRAE
jgi:hypothetical protein